MKYRNRLEAIILGGGRGNRLWPLTQMRAKPAVQIGGKYRLIDISVSNCINSGIKRIHILTQFNTSSLHNHIFQTYKFDIFSDGNIEILAAQQTRTKKDWFQGTADAVRSYWDHFEHLPATHYIILAGDHLYKMNYREFFQSHLDKKADISVAVKPIPVAIASEFGLLRVNKSGRITDFVEKPESPSSLFEDPQSTSRPKKVLASMGIYIFNKEILREALQTEGNDFGNNIIPRAIREYRTMAFRFKGYWEDIGTVGAFFKANISLTKPKPAFSFYDASNKLYTHPRFLPGSKISGARIFQSLISEGCIIGRSRIRNSILGIRSVVRNGVEMKRVYQMGADYYESEEDGIYPPLGVGEDSILENVILDKNVRVGKRVRLVNRDNIREAEGDFYTIKEGIIVVPKGAIIPDDTVL
ncbi:MAG: glucose-1-phosphate adenylyltransferase [FCB group bacterium]|nr:glucose-1-phosphate adenylyltransferase [FCB group bacterium]